MENSTKAMIINNIDLFVLLPLWPDLRTILLDKQLIVYSKKLFRSYVLYSFTV